MGVDLYRLITIDTEALHHRAEANHVDRLIFGRFGDRELGIPRIIDVLDSFGISGTFFVDFGGCELYGDKILDVVRYISGRGHDVQLHIHIEPLCRKLALYHGDGSPKALDTLNDADCDAVLEYTIDKYERCKLAAPLAYRAGALRLNAEMLRALSRHSLAFSSNYAARFAGKNTKQEVVREFRWSEDLVEIPIATALVNGSRVSFDYNSANLQSQKDYRDATNFYEQELDASAMCLLMHSWSLLDFPKTGKHFVCPDEDRSVRLSQWIDETADKNTFVSFRQLNDLLRSGAIRITDNRSPDLLAT